MTEPIPLLEDWRFWQIVVTGVLAFLGFTFGTWIKYAFDLRLDRIRRNKENTVFAVAFRAELRALVSDAKHRLHILKDFGESGKPVTAADTVRLDIPAKPVYANNTHRLGGLGNRVALRVVQAHVIADHFRQSIVGVQAYPHGVIISVVSLESFRVDFRELISRAATAINALDAFLGEPASFPDPKALAAEADPAGADAPEALTK